MTHEPSLNPLPAGASQPRRVEVVSTDVDLPLVDRVRITETVRQPLPAGQVRTGMLAMAVNPADLLQLDGRYGSQPSLPYVPGHEGVGVVLEVGSGIEDLAVGYRVLPMGPGGNWADERVVPRRQLVRISGAADVLQCAMLTANPATAWVLLRHMCALTRGDWVVQNAANSAVGQCVRQIAAQLGLRVLNVVRRADAVDQADATGSIWIVDPDSNAPTLREKAAQATQGAPIRLALDAVGGHASNALAHCLANDSLLVVYGLLGGRPCEVSGHDLVFRGLQVRGFWLASWFSNAENRLKAKSLYPDLVSMVEAKTLRMDIEAVYPLEQVCDALGHAARAGRSGKILLKGAWMDRVVPMQAAPGQARQGAS